MFGNKQNFLDLKTKNSKLIMCVALPLQTAALHGSHAHRDHPGVVSGDPPGAGHAGGDADHYEPQGVAGGPERLREIYGLDKPVPVQYWNWLKRIAVLDFGRSFSPDRRPVLDTTTSWLIRAAIYDSTNSTWYYLYADTPGSVRWLKAISPLPGTHAASRNATGPRS